MSIKWEEPGVGGLLSERTFIVSVPTSSYIFQNKSSCASFNRTIKWQYQCSESTLCGQKFADTCWCAADTASDLFPAVRRFIFQIMFEVNKLFFMEVNTEITSLSDYSFINLFFSVKYWIVSPLQVSGDQWNSQTLKLCGEVTHRYCIIIRVLEGLDVVINRGGFAINTFGRDILQSGAKERPTTGTPQETWTTICPSNIQDLSTSLCSAGSTFVASVCISVVWSLVSLLHPLQVRHVCSWKHARPDYAA